jgi:prepilin-type N-terminal cleavage/methylation domain-containing protein
MNPTSRPIGMNPTASPRSSRSRKGFTLAEVMIAAGIFVMAAFGLYTILIKAYELNTIARYHDDARAVLQTYADQFQRLQTAVEDPVSHSVYTRELFVPTDPTGKGLQYWYSSSTGALSVEASNATSFANNGSVQVTLGGSTNSVLATVTRQVQSIDPGSHAAGTHLSGHPNGGENFSLGTDPLYAAGKLLLGTFSITYQVSGRTVVQNLSILRADP